MNTRIKDMKHCSSLLIILITTLSSCTHKTEPTIKTTTDSLIHFAEAVAQMHQVKLSEIADTILFLPLEGKALVSQFDRINISRHYIFVGRNVYDINRHFLFKIGRRGQGPGEDVVVNAVFQPKVERFYSIGDKLIEYDKSGKFTGKELRKGVSMQVIGIADSGEHLALAVADTVSFLNTDLKYVKEVRVVPPWDEDTEAFNFPGLMRFFTVNMDSTLYYNYVNDTIYRLLDLELSPRWIMDLGDKKIPLKHLLGHEGKRYSAGGKYYTNDNLEDWDYLKETDNKIRVFSVFEAEDYLIMTWGLMRDFAKLRNYPMPIAQAAYYNKHTGKTTAVEGEGFTDDLSGVLGTFFPYLGTHNNYMITRIWPTDLKNRLHSSKQEVDQNLADWIEKLDDEDNPLLVFVHLKKIDK